MAFSGIVLASLTAYSMLTHDGRRLVSKVVNGARTFELVPTNALPANLPPVRPWTIYGIKSAHSDLGLHRSNFIQRKGTVLRIDEAGRLMAADHRADDDPAAMRYVIEGWWSWLNYPREKGEAEEMSCAWDTHVRYDRSAWPLCCTAALNRILPNYVQGMWMKTASGGIAATLYGPCTFETELPVGKVAFAERTEYPFDERIVLNVTAAPGKEFPLRLRIPGWCSAAEIAVNGAAVRPPVKNGFATLTRAWKTGDAVTLRFPMTPVAWDFRDNNEYGRLRRSLYVGPLLFAAAVPAKDDNTPAGPFVEPVLPQVAEPKSWTVERRPLPKVWSWQLDEAPVRLHVSAADGQPLTLVPYGCTKLRISAFGVEDRGKAN